MIMVSWVRFFSFRIAKQLGLYVSDATALQLTQRGASPTWPAGSTYQFRRGASAMVVAGREPSYGTYNSTNYASDNSLTARRLANV